MDMGEGSCAVAAADHVKLGDQAITTASLNRDIARGSGKIELCEGSVHGVRAEAKPSHTASKSGWVNELALGSGSLVSTMKE